jgi:hypothetical protein
MAAIGWPLPACAEATGLAWEAQIATEGSAPETMRVLTAGQRFKILRSEGGMQYLVRLDRDEMYFIDSRKRTYQKVKLSDLERAAESARTQLQAAVRHMQKELQQLPAEQRRLLEHMVAERGAAGTKAEVRQTGVTKTIAGYPCVEYIAEVAGKAVLKACTTDKIAAFERLRQDWLSVQQRLGKLNPLGGADLGDAYGQIPGFPLESEMGGVRAVVTKVEITTPSAAEFEVPSGFELRPGPPLPQ